MISATISKCFSNAGADIFKNNENNYINNMYFLIHIAYYVLLFYAC